MYIMYFCDIYHSIQVYLGLSCEAACPEMINSEEQKPRVVRCEDKHQFKLTFGAFITMRNTKYKLTESSAGLLLINFVDQKP